MTRRWFVSRVTLVALAVCAAAPAAMAQATGDAQALRRFDQAVDRYVALRQMIDRHAPSLEVSPNAWAIRGAVESRATAMRELRQDARVGDLFVVEVQGLFRSRIREALGYRLTAFADMLQGHGEEGDWPVGVTPNGEFSWCTATATPPAVLAALPPLPEMLQYRFVRDDLVLVDVDTNLVVDVLRHAIDLAPVRATH